MEAMLWTSSVRFQVAAAGFCAVAQISPVGSLAIMSHTFWQIVCAAIWASMLALLYLQHTLHHAPGLNKHVQTGPNLKPVSLRAACRCLFQVLAHAVQLFQQQSRCGIDQHTYWHCQDKVGPCTC